MASDSRQQRVPTKLCKACKSEIPADALKCRYCAEPQQWRVKHAVVPALTLAGVLLSLATSCYALYTAWHAKDSEIACTVNQLRLIKHSNLGGPPSIVLRYGLEVRQAPIGIWVVLQVRNDGSAPAFVEVFCKEGGCQSTLDVESGQIGTTKQIEPNHSRLLAVEAGGVNLEEARKLDEATLRGMCQKVVTRAEVPLKDLAVLYIYRFMFLRTTNQSGKVTQSYIVVDPDMLYTTVRNGEISARFGTVGPTPAAPGTSKGGAQNGQGRQTPRVATVRADCPCEFPARAGL